MSLVIAHNATDEEYEIVADHNELATVMLTCLPSTGASWTIYELEDVSVRSFNYLPEADNADNDVIGAEATMELQLLGKGGRVRLSYGRHWEDKAWRYLTIVVK